MELNIEDGDIDFVESAIVERLRAVVEGYESKGQSYADDLEISALRRALNAMGRPHSCGWNAKAGKNVVTAEY